MRKASPSDVPQLVAMMGEFYAESGFPLNHRRAADAFTTIIADDRLGYVFFIQAGAVDVGYVVATLCYSMEFGGPNAFVDDLFVRKPFRRAGLGTSALTELRDLCAKRGVRAIHVETGRDNAAA
jgi:GNAT superfamily N-acetyltransferase